MVNKMKFLLVNFGRMKLSQMENLVIVAKISETFPPWYMPDHHQVLQIISAYHNMQNQEKLMHIEQENGLKPHICPFLALIGPFLAQIIFFSKIGLRHFSPLIEG